MIDELQRMIDESNNIVFFGGAGVSTASGIKDFRSVDGLYNMKYPYPPEEILSHTFFINDPKEFYKFYKDKMNTLDKEPNYCHKYLVKLEKSGKLKGIITQNIDGLHTKAGSKNVLELHGTIYKNRCMECDKEYSADKVFKSKGVPKCHCGGIIKPEVTLYEEELNSEVVYKSIELMLNADMLIVAGTSLKVYPANSYINYFNGKYLVVINNDETYIDGFANLVINKDINEVFKKLH